MAVSSLDQFGEQVDSTGEPPDALALNPGSLLIMVRFGSMVILAVPGSRVAGRLPRQAGPSAAERCGGPGAEADPAEEAEEAGYELDDDKGPGLSAREREILMLVRLAMTNRQIARRMRIAEGTVKRHLHNIFRKLNAVSRIDALNKALMTGALDPDAR